MNLHDHLSLDGTPTSVGLARRRLDHVLAGWGVRGPVVDDATVAASELVTNAVLHGGGPTSFAVELVDDLLRIEVADRSTQVPAEPAYGEAQASTGRGLGLLGALARWGVRPLPVGKVVWAEIAVPPASLPCGPADGMVIDLAGPPPGVEVRLVDVPTNAFLALEAQDDAVQREVDLLLVGGQSGFSGPVPEDLLRLCRELRQRTGLPIGRWRGEVAEAIARGERCVELVCHLRPDVATALRSHLELVEAIEEEAEDGRLLVDPPTAEVVLLRRWAVQEVVAQLGGAPPAPPPDAVLRAACP